MTAAAPAARVVLATPDSRPAWDAFVAARPEGDILQTWAWGDVMAIAGEPPARVLVRGGDGRVRGIAQALVRPTSFGRSVLYVAHGPVWDRAASDGPATLRLLVDGLRRLARRERGIVVKVDPRGDPGDADAVAAMLRHAGLREARHDLQARTTRIVDLGSGGDALRKTWDKDARNLFRRAAKEGVATDVLRSPDADAIATFHDLLEETAERKGFRSHAIDFLSALAEGLATTGGWYLCLARKDGRAIGGMVTVRVADRAYYLYGASLRDPELKNANAGYATMGATMDALAADGVRTLDLWGVAESDADAPETWSGFSAFKRRFGGRPIRHAGTFDLVVDRFWYRVRDVREQLRGES
ncbi:MAG TPA: peptidoglycan bridge formation glycyltransferase FemA/FemB family protein [Candidatus Limnocylindrales bacterium]